MSIKKIKFIKGSNLTFSETYGVSRGRFDEIQKWVKHMEVEVFSNNLTTRPDQLEYLIDKVNPKDDIELMTVALAYGFWDGAINQRVIDQQAIANINATQPPASGLANNLITKKKIES